MARVLVLGATGYVGGRLVPRLLDAGHQVTCLVRDRRKVDGKSWRNEVRILEGDILRLETLAGAFDGAEVVYHLVHSMGAGEREFEQLDRTAARNVAEAAAFARVKRIIYLGGLGRREEGQSPHLRSRHEVGEVLREGPVPVTEFRAAVIVGSGSLSFELIHHLTNRLPVMICPRWVYTRTQPIGIGDVLKYLVAAVDRPESSGRIIDIGGPKVLTYSEMMLSVARILSLKRLLIPVPVLTPRLSSYWVNLVTPIPARIARPLIEGLRHETICENHAARTLFDIDPVPFEEAVRRALGRVADRAVETSWTNASSSIESPHLDPSHLKMDRRQIRVAAPAERLFEVVSSIGGENGWYYADWLWTLRGFIDQQLGGVGIRRGRRHPVHTSPGEALDFWRVEEYIVGHKLRLCAEMKVWGQAWLEFEVQPEGDNSSILLQTARYYPKGLFGLLYWYLVYPLHALVFRGMARAIGKRAERSHISAAATPAK